MSQHVAVLMGGLSSERSVSLRSGEACAKALEAEGFRVTRVDVGRDVAYALTALKPDVALNALHGPGGEDGAIQGLLETLRIPYTHSGVLASALAANKEKAKIVMAAAGVPVPSGKTVTRFEAAKAHVLPPPYVLKPVSEGSSYGVFIVKEDCPHPPQELLRPDWSHGDLMLAETFIAGRELTCAVMGDHALGVTEIKSVSSEWYDFDSKYQPGGSVHELPAKIKENIYLKVQELALKAHKALGCRGISRTDFRYDDTPGGTGALVVLEVNTQPGMTETSLAPEMAAHAGMTFGELVTWMVRDASCDR
ncbi:D-alanine-D-alanine ligase [Rhodoblastus acidophilus]|uniref:D-alanine--D-alanine ligase n=1 Tax=Rhodoblastus acidophilus TaxID=1074 RepID=UPI0022251734|nr:D-alanine--D-alanine ligase [Rhodoblastus acidophilus]MCW2285748.1 D-alanine-D-alanine ligase [Rhodoblastus acidophilus]MCW2333120.1 D-alanine-D-alanine ligase [Rhodoblastus acidophilus]